MADQVIPAEGATKIDFFATREVIRSRQLTEAECQFLAGSERRELTYRVVVKLLYLLPSLCLALTGLITAWRSAV